AACAFLHVRNEGECALDRFGSRRTVPLSEPVFTGVHDEVAPLGRHFPCCPVEGALLGDHFAVFEGVEHSGAGLDGVSLRPQDLEGRRASARMTLRSCTPSSSATRDLLVQMSKGTFFVRTQVAGYDTRKSQSLAASPPSSANEPVR